jgi:hypothetical protein
MSKKTIILWSIEVEREKQEQLQEGKMDENNNEEKRRLLPDALELTEIPEQWRS